MSDDDFIKYAGLDAWALIEFTALALKVLSGYALYGVIMIIVMACTWLETAPGDTEPPKGTLAKISIANLRELSDLATARWDRWLGSVFSAIGIWFLTVHTIGLLRRSWKRVVAHRRQALADATDTSSLTILVRSGYWDKATPDNPLEMHKMRWVWKMKSKAEAIELWEKLYPGCIYDVRMVRDTGTLPKLLKTREKLAAAIEKLEIKVINPETKAKAKAKAEALLDKKRGLFKENTQGVMTQYATACTAEMDKGSSYFVLFKKHRQANMAKMVCNLEDEHVQVLPCPALTDIRWESLRPVAERMAPLTSLGARAAYYAILALYMVPIGIVSGLLTIFELQKNFPFLKVIFDAMGDTFTNILAAFLPTLALILFLALLPQFCLTIAGLQNFPAMGQTTRDQFRRLFLFQFIWVFLGVTLGSSALALLEKLQDLAQNPLSVLTTMGAQLAGNAVFFMIYLAIQFCSALPMFHSRVVPVAIWWLLRRAQRMADAAKAAAAASAATVGGKRQNTKRATGDEDGSNGAETAKEVPVKPEPFQFAVNWTKVMLATCLGVCYAPIQPVAIVFAMGHLCLAYLIFKRALLYSFTHEYESRASFWPVASARLLIILFFAQLMLLATHSIKGNVVTAALIFLTMPTTYAAHRSFENHYAKQLDILPLEVSAGTDEEIHKKETSQRQSHAKRLSVGGRMSMEDATAIATREQERQKWAELFDGCFVQPELVEARKIVLENGGEVTNVGAAERPSNSDHTMCGAAEAAAAGVAMHKGGAAAAAGAAVVAAGAAVAAGGAALMDVVVSVAD